MCFRAFQFGWGPVCWILISEIPTARLRALNVAIGAATQWLFNFVIARSKLFLIQSCALVNGLVAVLTMQETMGQAGYVSQLARLAASCHDLLADRECSLCLGLSVISWGFLFGSACQRPRALAWRRWTNYLALRRRSSADLTTIRHGYKAMEKRDQTCETEAFLLSWPELG